MTSRKVLVGRLMPVLLGALALGSAGPAAWAKGTATALTVTTNPTPATSGQVVTMTAKVTINFGGTPAGGNVTFTDTYNNGSGSGNVTEVLGTVQVQSASGTQGTAILATEIGGNGNHNFVATFNGTSTPNLAASNSGTKTVNFAGLYASATSLAVTGTAAPYTLTGTVSAFGPKIPTGSVTFTDTTTSATLGTGTLTATPASQFTPFQSYPLANLNDGNTGSTIGPAIGDFNGDGHPDYAVPVNSGSVAILLGKGDGTFTNGTTITTTSPFEPTSVVVGDFDGDGDQDLAVLSANGIGSVNIYLGNGDGTFGTPKNFKVATASSGSRLLAIGDFNEDGIQDLVATNSSLNNVAVLLGKGDGTFNTEVSYAVTTTATGNLGQAPWNVVAGDLDGDGNLDLAVASDNAGSVTILLGNGDGTFQTPTYIPTGGQQVGSVAVADFNGDNKLDLATTSAGDNAVYVLLNTTSRRNGFSFGAPTKNTMNSGPYYLTIGDFDRDGTPDIISANNSSNNVGVLIGNGDGTFANAAIYGVGGAGAIFANAGDINGDDRVDLTAVTGNGLSVLLSGQWETATLSNVTVAGCSVQALVATYGGDGNYGASTSPAVDITNAALATNLTLGLAPANAAAGQQISLTATLAPYSQGSTSSNGDLVSFYNGATLLGTAPLASGVAVLNYVLPAGAFSFQAKFPGDCSFAKSNSNTLSGTALQASTLTWANPAPIPVGTALSNTQLNATDSVPGTFVYTPVKGTVLAAGTQTLSVTFTPTSSAFGVQTATVQIVVQPATTITWPTPTPITYGTPLSGFQLDATASTGVISVPLSTLYNVTGIYTPKSTYTQAASFDNDGYSYQTTSLSGTVVWNGLTFTIGPNNAPDAVSNISIPLPAGNYSNLYMLGAMVNNIAASQTFIVTYTDNSTLTFTQNMSDWFNAKGWAGEAVVNCSEDRNYEDGTSQPDSACLFGYQIPLDSTKTVKSVQLPGTRNIVMLAMDLTTPSIPGTFTYTPPAGTIEPVGTNTLNVSFTPTDTTHYQSATASVQLKVNAPVGPVTTTISWPTPAPIVYGTPLSATQLDAVAMGLANPTPVVPTDQLQVLSTSTDANPYNLAGFDNNGLTYSYNLLNNGQVNYANTTFTLGKPGIPNALTNGAVYTLPAQGNYQYVYLIGAAIAAQANVPFVLTYSDGTTTTPTQNMSAWSAYTGDATETKVATMTYVNNQAGNKVTSTHYLYGYKLTANVGKTLVSVTIPSTRNVVVMALGFGTNNTVVVPGTYVYTPPATTIEPVGTDTLSVTFTPTNSSGYTTVTGTTQLVVTKATPVITWPTPTPINVYERLTGTQLDATAATPQGASLPGTFVYSPVAGTYFTAAGIYPLNVTFTPTDTTDYTTATASVNLTVGHDVAVSSGAIEYTDCCFFSQPTPYTITVAGDATFLGLFPVPPTGSVTVIYNGTILATGSLSVLSGSASTATLLVPSIQFVPGNNNITIQYSGDSFFYGVTNTPATIVLRNPAIPVSPAAVNQTVVTSIPYRFVQDATLTFSYTPHSASSSEFTDGAGTGDCINNHQYSAGNECTFNVAFKPVAPGVRKGVIQVNFAPRNGSQTEPILYLFLSGTGNASQMTLGNGKQKTLNAGLNQPQGLAFNPTDTLFSQLYVSNSNASQIVTLPSSGGPFAAWNTANSTGLVYPTDLSYNAFADLLVADAYSPKVFSFSPTLAESTIGTGTIALGLPTANRVDLGGNLYIADGGNTPQVVMVPGEIYDTDYKSSVLLNSTSVSFPQSLGVDNAGANLYVGDGSSNQVVKVALATGTTSQFALAPCDALVTPCAFNGPSGFAFDPNGDMYLIDATRLLMVPATHSSGSPTLLMPLTGLLGASAVALDGTGNIYVTDVIGSVYELVANAGTMSITGVGGKQTTTLTNTGNQPLTFTSLTLTAGGTNFTEADTCAGKTIATGASCTITVTSKAAGTPSATLTIVSNSLPTNTATIQIN
jgi:hypothetical protein